MPQVEAPLRLHKAFAQSITDAWGLCEQALQHPWTETYLTDSQL